MNEYKVTARKSGGAIIGTLIRGDNGTAAVRVVIPRYANGVDLAPLAWSVHVANASGAADVVIPTAVIADDASVTFEWLPGGVATAAAGMTDVHFEGVDEGALVWASATYHLRIDDKNDATQSGEDAQKLTELQQLIVFVSGELNGVIEAGRAAQEAANRANEAAKRAESIEGVAIDETLTQPGAAADAAVVGGKFDKFSEEIADLPNHVTQNVLDNLTKIDVEGDFIQIEPKEGTKLHVVSTFSEHAIPPEVGPWIEPSIYLTHVTSKNLFDGVNALGGAGTTVTKNGVTVTLNDDGTFLIDGAWTGAIDGYVIRTPDNMPHPYCHTPFPAGTYTTDPRVRFSASKVHGNGGYGNKWGGTTFVEGQFIFSSFGIYAKPGDVFNNEIRSLAFVRGTALPDDDHRFIGDLYKASMSSAKKNGRWQRKLDYG